MADTAQPLIPSNSQPAGVPETPGAGAALPVSLPPEMTPELAQGRLAELKSDHDWQQRWLAGDVRANSEFDALTRKAVGQQLPAPIAPRDEHGEALRALGAPAKPEDYRLDNVRGPDGGFVQMDQAT